jgi:uncharacterized protein YegL
MDLNFGIESFFNPHLAVGASRIDAILTVTTSSGTAKAVTAAPTGRKAVVFIIDLSGSMQGDKLMMGKIALRKCVDLLDENTYFSVIGFSDEAEVIAPMTLATTGAKENAHARIKELTAGGSTYMSKALLMALSQFAKTDNAICYCQMVTDGENDTGDKKALNSALVECEGKFRCDCWGVGTDWKPDQLRLIAGKLLGSADAVPNPEQLEIHFKEALAQALSKGIGDVRLRLQMPKSCKILTVKQMSPEIVDLSILAKRVDERNLEVPLGAWGEESRDYHVAFELEPQPAGEEMMACRPRIIYSQNGAEVVSDGPRIVAAWTTDESLTTRINSHVAHYTGQEELANSIREGLEAKARGNIDQATVLLGKAAKIAIETGNEEVTQRLKKVVDVIDADQGTVRLRAANKAADLELDMGGTRTVRRRPATGSPEVK